MSAEIVSRLELRSTIISSAIDPINHALRHLLVGFAGVHERRGVWATRGVSALTDLVSLSCTPVFLAVTNKVASCIGWRSGTIAGPGDEELLAGVEWVDFVNPSASVNGLAWKPLPLAGSSTMPGAWIGKPGLAGFDAEGCGTLSALANAADIDEALGNRYSGSLAMLRRMTSVRASGIAGLMRGGNGGVA